MPVLVVAKAPNGGRSKTRLVPPLSADQAALLHEALLLDTIDACCEQSSDVRLLCATEHDSTALGELVPGVPRVVQEGVGLGEALRLGIARHISHGPTAVVSSDIPGLPENAIPHAFAALAEGADVVLGPAADGGYWLLAMRAAHDELFVDIPWSTPAVLAVTRERCVRAGLELVELDVWRDIDTPVDLELVRRGGERLRAPRTRAVLDDLADYLDEAPDVTLDASELLSGSPWRAVIRDRLRIDGRETEYTYLAVPRAVFVAAVTGAGELLLVRQYRHPVRDWTLEVPAGSLAEGESSLEAAQRELREETGGLAGTWTHLTTFYSSSAHLSLRSDAWLASDVEVGDAMPEEDENVTLVRMPLAEAVEHARTGGFAEGQTALTVLLAAEALERGLVSRT
jgi:rSAM/selenodomain-associated transferase 1